ncbi:MAG: polyprenol monophosphomannose synthase [Candidatus Pacebacteria bacterium]|nr:polyprenol monophosphomannose synthase [Candidatus Paceibacterota bacterium]
MKITVIVPTYNEKSKIGLVIDALEKEFRSVNNHQAGILVVDGNSSDGTLDIVREKSKEYSNVELLIEKEKRGLGMAYIEGMNYAMNVLKTDAFIEFDGDFQHDPADVPRLIRELDNGYDYVIGSRYVPGGKIPSAWGLHRKILSRFGSLFVKILLGLKTNDNTSGLKLSRVKNFAEKLPLDGNKILSKRYAYKVHLLYEMAALGAKIKEIPIVFLEREGGVSKSSVKDVIDTLRVACVLFLRKIKRVFGGNAA